MFTRVSLILLLVSALATAVAGAAVIDPELQDVLGAKADGELVEVMMLMDNHADLAALDAQLAEATPQQRREAVIAALQSYSARSQAEALAILRDAELSGQAERIRSLWLANGIAFRGTRQVVESVAATKATGTLVHDKAYDMVSAVMAPRDDAKASGIGDRPPHFEPTQADTAWGVRWIDATRVWIDTGYTGAGIVVGHFDTGVWLTHPDIVNRLWVNPGEIPGNMVDDDGNGYVDDVHGWDFGDQDSDPNDDVIGTASNHGTHTAGTVCGDGTNGTITGVAPGASVMVCKSFNSDGSGAPFSAIFEGQQYAIMMGARVFTMSLGIGCDLGTSRETLMRTERITGDGIRAAGVIFFNSAGNDHWACNPPLEIGLTARVPAPWNPIAGTPYTSLGGVMAVGGTGYRSDTAYSSSSQGPVNWDDIAPWNDWPYPPGLIKPDVSAPGTQVNSLQKPSGYTGDTWSGTSMSCPHAAGLAALMLEKNPSLSPAGVDSLMEQTAVDLSSAGKDNVFGSGRIDALAAVNAVPVSVRPHLVWTAVTLDPTGNEVFDPGETVDLVFELTNNSPIVAATPVTAGIAVVANPYVTVVDGSATFGTIAMNGGTADNSGDVFQLQSTGGAPQGYTFTVLLTVYAQNGYQKTFDIELFVGLPEWLTHEIGNVFLTVTDQGIIGYMDDAQTAGDGFGRVGGGSFLFLGSFWGGTDQNYICNRDYNGTGAGAETFEWIVTSTPNGRVKNLGAGAANQTFQSVFSDAGHTAPKPMVVTQTSYAWVNPPNDDFVMICYSVRNDGAATVSGYHGGIFADMDVDSYDTNEGSSDASRHLTYMYSTAGNYVGIALLGPHPASNLTHINNPTYVYPDGAISNSIKARHLRGLISLPTTTGPDDWSMLTSGGPSTIAAGDSVRYTFAMVWGESLADLQANTDAAQALHDLTEVGGETPLREFALSQNQPNPFNPATTIYFSVEKAGPVRLTVYDMSGRKVRSLLQESYGVGEHHVVWDGRNDAGSSMPSGLYFYRYESNGMSVARKMMLVK